MPHCTRKGCGKEFEQDSTEKCTFHPGAPVFHEGLKSWSCCSDVYKPVLDFDEFMKIPGCTESDRHTEEAQRVAEAPRAVPKTNLTLSESTSGIETYTSAPRFSAAATPAPAPAPAPTPAPVVEEEDDATVTIKPGTQCRRNGCKTPFVSDEVNRHADGESSVCTYHPSPPIFHEGSKGYVCCRRRVLEFDEFLKIPGCKTGRHLFSPAKTAKVDEAAEEMATCRIDHYQTVDQVHVSIFAKQADNQRSTIKFEGEQVVLDIYFLGRKRFSRVLELFGPIDPSQSKVQYYGTKVELHLKKQDNRSWTLLEKTNQDVSHINFTFGVGGRTGTIGGKDLVLDETNKARP